MFLYVFVTLLIQRIQIHILRGTNIVPGFCSLEVANN